MTSVVATLVLVALVISFIIQTICFYIGCKNQCLLSYNTLQNVLMVNRTLSFILYFTWIKLAYGSWFNLNVVYNCLAVLFITMGQYLNVYMYYKLGKDNIYYGREYGVTGPPKEYFTGFPFNLKHPQYIGCILTGVGVFFLTGFDRNGKMRMGVFYLILYIINIYLISMLIENNCYKRAC